MSDTMPEIPTSYRPGVRFVNSLTDVEAVKAWLQEELLEIHNILAGSAEDQPVQAFLNHHPYFSAEARFRIVAAFEELVHEWITLPQNWLEPAPTSLLQLVAEIPVPSIKTILCLMAESEKFPCLGVQLQAGLLRAIATLSSKDDTEFWLTIQQRQDAFARMADQVLARI